MAMRNWIEKYIIETGIAYGAGLCLLSAIILQLSFQWPAMIIAGIFGGVFVKRRLHALFAGFWGVATAWAVLFLIHVEYFQAYEIGEFFAILIGFPGLGRFVVSLSILFGGLLGASGALVGYSSLDLYREFQRIHTHPDEKF